MEETFSETPKDEDHICEEHQVKMEKKISKTKGTPYYAHFDTKLGICFGEGYKGKSY